MPTCVCTPRKPKLYVAMAGASSTFTAFRLSEASSFRRKKFSMRNKLNDVYAFPDRIKSVLRACSEGKLLWIHFHFASNKANL